MAASDSESQRLSLGADGAASLPVAVSQAPEPARPNMIVRLFQLVFGYRKTLLTLLTAVVYLAAVFFTASSQNTDGVDPPAKGTHELLLLALCWRHLQHISEHPHPYDSHFNDVVREYIASEVDALAARQPWIEWLGDQEGANHLLYNQGDVFDAANKENRIVYYESNNVVARVNGSDPSLPALLLSAHFDLVPSAYGTTDDGVGIAALLAVLEHYASAKQPQRTLVFNFNNDEEFGLLGALLFFLHPYAESVGYFLNLEGTGAGGKAVLFRATDTGVALLYSAVRSPFATLTFQQAFAARLVHSETDYKIYAQHGLRGVDIAFYRPRSWYHTARDAIGGTNQRAVWHMLSAALDYTNAAVAGPIDDLRDPAVFADVLGRWFVVISTTQLYAYNVAAAVVGLVVVLLLLVVVNRRGAWLVSPLDLVRYPAAVIVAGNAVYLLAKVFAHWNPMIPLSDYATPIAALAAVFALVAWAVLKVLERLATPSDDKLVALVQLLLCMWVVLIALTVGLRNSPAAHSGEYALLPMYVLVTFAAAWGLAGWSAVRPVTLGERDLEHTPLLQSDGDLVRSGLVRLATLFQAPPQPLWFFYDWLVQFVVSVPAVVLLLMVTGRLALEGLNQTIQESAAATALVFKLLWVIGALLVLPAVPFISKVNRYLVGALAVLAFVGSYHSMTAEPFTYALPLKVRFLQTASADGRGEQVVLVLGREGFVGQVLSDLPLVQALGHGGVNCTSVADGSEVCRYPGLAPHLTAGKHPEPLLEIEVVKNGLAGAEPYAPLSGEIRLKVVDNRNCVISFNTSSYTLHRSGKLPVKAVVVYGASNSTAQSHTAELWLGIPKGPLKDANGLDVYKEGDGIDELQVHKLSWLAPFHLGFRWVPNFDDLGLLRLQNALGVTVQCYWGEYNAVLVGGGEVGDKIPAYSELLQYVPSNVTVANWAKGLAVVEQYVEL